MAKQEGRGHLGAIKLLPGECSPVIAWADEELRKNDRTQLDIYAEFKAKLEALQEERSGEIIFQIPSFAAFNRHSIKLAVLTRRTDEAREISGVLAKSFNAKASDDLTIIAAEAIKTLVFELIQAGGEAGHSPKGALDLATALYRAAQAQGVSTSRRVAVEEKFETQMVKAVDAVAKAKGMSAETAESIKSQILGVKAAA